MALTPKMDRPQATASGFTNAATKNQCANFSRYLNTQPTFGSVSLTQVDDGMPSGITGCSINVRHKIAEVYYFRDSTEKGQYADEEWSVANDMHRIAAQYCARFGSRMFLGRKLVAPNAKIGAGNARLMCSGPAGAIFFMLSVTQDSPSVPVLKFFDHYTLHMAFVNSESESIIDQGQRQLGFPGIQSAMHEIYVAESKAEQSREDRIAQTEQIGAHVCGALGVGYVQAIVNGRIEVVYTPIAQLMSQAIYGTAIPQLIAWSSPTQWKPCH
jgi:hypothetical protein